MDETVQESLRQQRKDLLETFDQGDYQTNIAKLNLLLALHFGGETAPTHAEIRNLTLDAREDRKTFLCSSVAHILDLWYEARQHRRASFQMILDEVLPQTPDITQDLMEAARERVVGRLQEKMLGVHEGPPDGVARENLKTWMEVVSVQALDWKQFKHLWTIMCQVQNKKAG